MSIITAIFDCDGVLVDTEGLKHRSLAKILASEGITLEDHHYQKLVGFSAEANVVTINSLFDKDFDLTLYDRFEEQYVQERIEGVAVIERNVALVRELARRDVRMGLASSDSHSNIVDNLRIAGLSDLFEIVVSGKDDLPIGSNKPHPLIYQTSLEQLGVEPHRAIVVEDTVPGAEAGKRAKAQVLAVPNSYTKEQDFSSWADLRCEPEDNFEEVFEKLLALLD